MGRTFPGRISVVHRIVRRSELSTDAQLTGPRRLNVGFSFHPSCWEEFTDRSTLYPEVPSNSVRVLWGMFFQRIFEVKTSKDRAGADARPVPGGCAAAWAGLSAWTSTARTGEILSGASG